MLPFAFYQLGLLDSIHSGEQGWHSGESTLLIHCNGPGLIRIPRPGVTSTLQVATTLVAMETRILPLATAMKC